METRHEPSPSFLLLLRVITGLYVVRPAQACPLAAGCHHPCCRAVEYYWDFYGTRKCKCTDWDYVCLGQVQPPTMTGNWKLRNAAGQDFSSVYVMIKVPGSGTGGGASSPFAVTSVVMASSGSCGAFTITAAITTNGPGSVTYKWIRSDGATDTLTHDPVVFTGAGTQVVSTTWSVSTPGTTFWMEIYIDAPNHQQFGRATFSCP